MAIGNTGCGKSTLLYSLLHGPASLHQVKVQNRKVIEPKETVNEFKIGHSSAASQTFLPEFQEDKEDKNLLFVDIAGLSDTSGPMIEMVNTFMNRIILRKAQNVKILMPMQIEQITGGRGSAVRQQFQTIQNMIGAIDPNIADSIIPLVTKASPTDQENSDIDVLRNNLSDQLDQLMNQ